MFGTVTTIMQRPAGPADYVQIGREMALREVTAMYQHFCREMGTGRGPKSKDVKPSGEESPKQKAAELKTLGRGSDTELAHVNKREMKMLKDSGGRGSINPKTGLREFDDGGGGGGGDGSGDGSGAGAGASDQSSGFSGYDIGGGLFGGDASNTAAASPGSQGTGDTSGQAQGAAAATAGPGDALTGGVQGSSPSDVAALGGGAPGAGFGGPGGPAGAIGGGAFTGTSPNDAFSQAQVDSLLGAPTGAREGFSIGAREGANTFSADPSALSIFGLQGLNSFQNAVHDILGSIGILGSVTGSKGALGTAAALGGPVGNALGGVLGSAIGFGSNAAGLTGLTGSGRGGGNLGASGFSGPSGPGPSGPSGPSAPGSAADSEGDTGTSQIGQGTTSTAKQTASTLSAHGDPANTDVQAALSRVLSQPTQDFSSVLQPRPGSREIAGTPYAPDFGGSDTINPAALSAALNSVGGRPRVGPGQQFGRTTYL